MTREESKIVVYGWPKEGTGIWVLRYDSKDDIPDNFSRLRLALTMEERIVLIQEFDAEFVEDASQVPELQDYYRNQSSGPTAEI